MKRMKRILWLLLPVLLLCGCAEGSAEQVRAGRALMKSYLAQRGGKASVSSIYADVHRVDADRLELSDFVKGTFSADGETYSFWADVVTGEVYTSERMDEFTDCCSARTAELLGLDPSQCVGSCIIALERSFALEYDDRTEYFTLDDVLPVTVGDMDAFVRQALEAEDVTVQTYLVCRGVTELSGRWTELGGTGLRVFLCALADPDAPLPLTEEVGWSYWKDFTGEKVRIDPDGVEYTPAA